MDYQNEYYLRFGLLPDIPVLVRPEKTCMTNEEIAEDNKLTLNSTITMNMNELKIEVPQGMVIDTENSSLKEGIIKFKPAKKQLPRTWEEFCETHTLTEKDCTISTGCRIYNCIDRERAPEQDKNIGTIETCKAVLALMQLIQLRDCYNDGWNPDWSNIQENKYVIFRDGDNISKDKLTSFQFVLNFKTVELRDTFLNNFRDLIEIAKPLI